jgi:tetratricopeptide (TPR) repeat protein
MYRSWWVWVYNDFLVLMLQGVCDGPEFFVSRWLVRPWGCCFEGNLYDLHWVNSLFIGVLHPNIVHFVGSIKMRGHWIVLLNLSEISETIAEELLQARDVEKALDGFTRAVQLDPENGEAWNNIACLYVLFALVILLSVHSDIYCFLFSHLNIC